MAKRKGFVWGAVVREFRQEVERQLQPYYVRFMAMVAHSVRQHPGWNHPYKDMTFKEYLSDLKKPSSGLYRLAREAVDDWDRECRLTFKVGPAKYEIWAMPDVLATVHKNAGKRCWKNRTR